MDKVMVTCGFEETEATIDGIVPFPEL